MTVSLLLLGLDTKNDGSVCVSHDCPFSSIRMRQKMMAQCMSHDCLSSSVRTRHTKMMAQCVSHDFLSSSVRTRHKK